MPIQDLGLHSRWLDALVNNATLPEGARGAVDEAKGLYDILERMARTRARRTISKWVEEKYNNDASAPHR